MPAMNNVTRSMWLKQLVLAIVAVGLATLFATFVWQAIPIPVKSPQAGYVLILLGPASAFSAHASIVGVAALTLPVVLLVWRVLGWKTFRSVFALMTVVYWIALGAFFSIGAL